MKTVTRNVGAGLVAIMAAAAAAAFVVDDITTVAGNGSGGFEGDGGSALLAKIKQARGVDVDADGNIYIADTENHRIRKVDIATDTITTIAGNGGGGYEGDDGLATLAKIKKPWDVGVDAAGNVYIADTENHRIRMVDAATGIISTVAGSGSGKFFGDGGSAVGARVKKPSGAAWDSAGNAIIADTENHVIRKVTVADGIITTIAGTGSSGYSGDGGAATAAEFDKPHGVWVDSADNIFVADTNNHRIRRIDGATGIVTTVAGIGSAGDTGDGGQATLAKVDAPEAIALDSSGNIFIADTGSDRIRKVDAGTGVITTVAGTGAGGYFGDGGLATLAKVNGPKGVWVREATAFGFQTVFASLAGSRNIQTATQVTLSDPVTVTAISAYVGGRGDDVRFAIYDDNAGEPNALLVETATATAPVAADWVTLSVASTPLAAGDYWLALETNHSVEKYRYDAAGGATRTVSNDATADGFLTSWGASATSTAARLSMYVNTNVVTSVYIADSESSVIRRFVEGGNIETVAGNGSAGYDGDGGAATAAEIKKPEGIAVDGAGNLYIADTENHRIRRVDGNTGIITTHAGTGSGGYSGDAELATISELKKPGGIWANAAGDVLFPDTENHAVRWVDASTGVIESLAGSGVAGYSGDGGAGVGASVKKPGGIHVMPNGDFYIADTENHVVRKVTSATGIITTVAGNNTSDYAGDGGSAVTANLKKPAGVWATANGDVYIADTENHAVRKVAYATGIITTIAGTGSGGYTGDGGLATNAKIKKPSAVAVDGRGNVYFVDMDNTCIRMVEAATGIIETVVGTGSGGYSGDGGPANLARIEVAWGLDIDPAGDLYIADTDNDVIRMVDLPGLSVRIISWQETAP